jgi:ATPase subunit of ABC transporter with duplicated ATPase domains
VKVNGNVEEDAQDIVGVYGENGVGDGTRMKRTTRKMRMRDEEAVSVSWVSAWLCEVYCTQG